MAALEKVIVNGRSAVVSWLSAAFEPVSSREDAHLAKVVFDDDQSSVFVDARPVQKASSSQTRTLYVSRRLLNEGAVRAWAASQGFESALPAGDMHVTVAYSKEPVNWSAIEPDRDALAVQGGARSVHQFDGGAVVLTLESPELQRRWQELRDAGASWDYPDYRPHVTITYSGVPADLSAVEPYRGPLIFGPEEMEEVDPEGFDPDSIEEEALLKALYGIRRRGSIPRRTSRRM